MRDNFLHIRVFTKQMLERKLMNITVFPRCNRRTVPRLKRTEIAARTKLRKTISSLRFRSLSSAHHRTHTDVLSCSKSMIFRVGIFEINEYCRYNRSPSSSANVCSSIVLINVENIAGCASRAVMMPSQFSGACRPRFRVGDKYF